MTVKQAQCLLLYLGYYPGAPDGVGGPKTKYAVSVFQREDGLTETGQLDETTGKMLVAAVAGTAAKVDRPQTGSFWDGIKYFKPDEDNICCPCPRCVGKKEYPTEALMKMVPRRSY